ncbi:MAG: antirestriction protein, partial [Beijerinckiaceae bacterium]
PINWHRTAFHELSHWSGASSRLGRDFTGSFGSKSYAREELVALS